MEYYEFACAGAPAVCVISRNPDPARLPAAASGCCRQWQLTRSFRLGDGSHPPVREAAIAARVAAEGYHIYVRRPDESPGPGQPGFEVAGVAPGIYGQLTE